IPLPNGKTLKLPDGLSEQEQRQIIAQELNPAFGAGTTTQYQPPTAARAEPLTVPQPQPQPRPDPGVLPTVGALAGGLATRSLVGPAIGARGGELLHQYLGITRADPNATAM